MFQYTVPFVVLVGPTLVEYAVPGLHVVPPHLGPDPLQQGWVMNSMGEVVLNIREMQSMKCWASGSM